MGFGLERPSVSSTIKWLGFVTAIWVQAISGNNYTFSNYSDALKTLMNLTQLELNNLSVAKDVGKAFGLLAGLASDRFPTWVLLLIGSVEGLVGYGAQWLVVSQKIQPLSYWQMCIFLCMGGNSTTWMNTAVLVTCIRNFRSNRGPVSGILKGYVGLSTAIFTDLCTALFNDNSGSFLFMLAVTPFAVCLTAMVFLHEIPPSSSAAEDKQESRYFWFFNGLAFFVAVYLLAYDFIPDPSTLFSHVFSAILLLLLASPLVVPAYSYFKSWAPNRVGSSDPEKPVAVLVLDEPLLAAGKPEVVPSSSSSSEDDVAVVERRRRPVIGEEHTIFEAMRTLDFWILFVSFLCGVGTGLAVMNNLGQIGLALGYADVSIFVSLTSIWGFFGRIVSGMVSEYFIRKAAIPRPLWNAASQILMAVGYILLAIAMPGSLYIGSIVVGICYGVRLAITVPAASELFGLKYYGLIYNVLILNLPLGSLLFSGLLAGFLYDMEATPTAGGGNTCIGAHCYRLVFVVMAIACVVGFGLDILLSIRTRRLYTKIQAGKKTKRVSNGTS
ncbi:putative major facilitator superfamily domain-containing protein [Rosa chinensis]|uniref:Putative major facilitator superfamily domain-containing protein n=1 Tax=Rosa chinensis TaxID=74649 RepID=A0A2P6PIW7_ROSCH|nr:protein NUCLEAR FUSION DEFECTIVE 4 [Rosa chinensis]PRQ21879.1 putative major facilitator superfamily domain-containing protein [Rosa chinensis]